MVLPNGAKILVRGSGDTPTAALEHALLPERVVWEVELVTNMVLPSGAKLVVRGTGDTPTAALEHAQRRASRLLAGLRDVAHALEEIEL